MDIASFTKALEKTSSPEHVSMLKFVNDLVEMSRKKISCSYDKWDMHCATFKSEKAPDKEDRAALAKGQPAKMIVPLTFSQTMTFVAFCVSTVTQNKRFYELEPTGTEDNPLREPLELILERDTRKNNWTNFLVQFFLDAARMGVTAAEVCYEEQFRWMRAPVEQTTTEAFGVEETTTPSTFIKIPFFEGNRIHPVSPYRIFPDLRLPLTRYQEGEFCASQDLFSMSTLRSIPGLINLDKIPRMSQTDLDAWKEHRRIDTREFQIRENKNQGGDDDRDGEGDYVQSGTVLITKGVYDIVPKNFKHDDKTLLGNEDFPVRFIVWVANDKTIVRFEEAYYLHGQFPYIIAQFLPDQLQIVNDGLADVCDQITTLITWLINAHITAVRSMIEGKLVVDPAGVDIKSLESRSPYIYLRKNASQMGVDRYIKQLQVQDPTVNFMQDSSMLNDMMEKITALSGNMMGQYSNGRRSATEARVVTQGAAARAKTTLAGIWDSAFEPLGRQLICNNRQEMSFETFSRILGKGPFGENPDTGAAYTTQELYGLFKGDPMSIASGEDFFVFDGTLPSEKAFLAQSLQEILMTMLQNPEVSSVLGYGPEQFKRLFEDVYNLRGVTNSRLPAPMVAPPQPSIVPMPAPTLPPTSAVSNGQ